MAEKSKLWIPQFCELLVDIEEETHRELGEQAALFANVWNDWLTIETAISDLYPQQTRFNLVYHVFTGLSKDLSWYHFLFVAGNYPYLNGRLRLAWESIFRAYFAETYQGADGPGPSMDDKVVWLELRRPKLTWETCIKPMVCRLFPLADQETDVLNYYFARWNRLNAYHHPSEYLSSRLIDESALHVRDSFDKNWAVDTISLAINVFDLIWLAVLMFHDRAIAQVAQKKLLANYPIVGLLLEREGQDYGHLEVTP